jgi:hypothetical protein
MIAPIAATANSTAEGLLEGMKKEEYLVVVPASLVEMVKPQGRDVGMLNAWVADPPPLKFPPPDL